MRTERGVQKDFEKCSNSTQSAVSLKLLNNTLNSMYLTIIISVGVSLHVVVL